MISGFARAADGTVTSLDEWCAVADAWDQTDSRFWLDLENPSDEDIYSLRDLVNLDDTAIEDCVHGQQRPRLDDYDSYLVLLLYGVLDPLGGRDTRPRELPVFCGERFLVTVHRKSLSTVNALRERCEKHGSSLFDRGLDFLLYHLIDLMVDNYLLVLDRCDDELEKLEERSFGVGEQDSIPQETAKLRKKLVEIRRLVSAQRSLLAPMAKGDFDYISTQLAMEFRHVEDHLAHALDQAEAMGERLTGVLHNYHASLAERTNQIIRVLTSNRLLQVVDDFSTRDETSTPLPIRLASAEPAIAYFVF